MKQELSNIQFLLIDKQDQEKTVTVLNVQHSPNCPPRFTIDFEGNKPIIELQQFDDYRVLFHGTLHGFPYVQAYLIGARKYIEDVYIRLVR